MEKFKSVDELVKQLRPTEPVYCIRRKSIQISSSYFKNRFPGKILYSGTGASSSGLVHP